MKFLNPQETVKISKIPYLGTRTLYILLLTEPVIDPDPEDCGMPPTSVI